ncbi:bis(5'-nucleosyl)-tetraphosphatase (symmetrical) YqeK [Rubrobacter calidifluminis]|uniref:bis(5'-nucleosyl)-tetraphosphatase (symmetrical) YqeK n=1 Tax=Rubrobacter calidifluminis TaxID=1392640 RepID=UPI00235EE6F3|nr:bis(5'-nucleosyl)-tetraphosphatase (symmetrical) YqeK [Rubrobacter calidifluminis]
MAKDMTPQEAEEFVRSLLSEKRYAHTLRVARTAEDLAYRHNIDPARARLAGLLHDAARDMGGAELLRLAGEWKLPVDGWERENPKLLHGPVAAEMARRRLGLTDEEVLDAIRVHTTGAAGMGPLALALYVADKIEPGRDYPSVGRLRKLAEGDLAAAAAESLRTAISYNEKRGRQTHPASVEALRWLEREAGGVEEP